MANTATTSRPQPQGAGGNSAGKGAKKAVVTTGAMTVLMVTNIVSMRGLASQAEYGYTSIFYYVAAAIIFLIPYALVCAELASTWTKSGGLFRWCTEGCGPKWGWAAMFYDWILVVIWFPAVLMFGAVTLAYLFWPESFDAKLSQNVIYTLIVVLAIYWTANFNMFRGQNAAAKLSTAGGLFGTIIPAIVLIILGIVYICLGGHNYIDANQSFWPDFSKFGTIVLAASIFLFFAGMEMQAVHVPSMRNPAKEFPKAIMYAVTIILVIFIAGTLAIGFVIPKKDITLLASLLVAYNQLFAYIHCEWLGHIIAIMLTFGVVGQVSCVIAAPSTGLLSVGRAGYLPRPLQKVNKNDVQTNILWIQAILVSILALALVVLPSVQSAYQLLNQMSTIIYLAMVFIVYFTFIRLRRTEPNAKRGFRVPGGNVGKWLVTIIGSLGALLALGLSFLPPTQINIGSPVVYVVILVICSIIFIGLPFVIFAKRKPSWRDPLTTFEPFDWEIEGRRPSQVSKWAPGYQPTPEMVERAKYWEDGAFGPASMKNVYEVAETSIAPDKSILEQDQAMAELEKEDKANHIKKDPKLQADLKALDATEESIGENSGGPASSGNSDQPAEGK